MGGGQRGIRKLFGFVLPYILDYAHVAERPEEVTDKVLNFYFGKPDSTLRWLQNTAVIGEVSLRKNAFLMLHLVLYILRI
jgi:hypothetical protein